MTHRRQSAPDQLGLRVCKGLKDNTQHNNVRISTRSSPRSARDDLTCLCVSCALRTRGPRFSGLRAAISAVRCDFVALSVCALSVSVCKSESRFVVRKPVRKIYPRLTSLRSHHDTSIQRCGAFVVPIIYTTITQRRTGLCVYRMCLGTCAVDGYPGCWRRL